MTFIERTAMVRKDIRTFYHLTNEHQHELLDWAEINDPLDYTV